MLLHDLGFDFIKNGEEGYVTLKDFSLSVRKRWEGIIKFEREGYTFEMIEPPFSKELIQELKQVSDSWLDGQLEKGFSLGFWWILPNHNILLKMLIINCCICFNDAYGW